MITTVCKISYGSQTVPPIVPAVQGDTGRAISFEIADFTPPAGATATYFILKPSGEAIYNSATITDNSILCELTAQSLAEAGENRMQVRVLQGENIVTSFEVILMVRTFLGDDAIESGTEMNIFDQAVEQATEQFQENAEQIVAEVIESIPADYTELTEEVDELNERLGDVKEDLGEVINVDADKVSTKNTSLNASGEIIDVDGLYSWMCYTAPIKAGIRYTVTHHESQLICAFFSGSSAPIIGSVSYNGQRIVQASNVITAPIDGWVVFRSVPTKTDEKITYLIANDKKARADADSNTSRIQAIENAFDTSTYYTETKIAGEYTENYYMSPDGTATYNTSYAYSQKIDVVAGDIISVVDSVGVSKPMRFVTAYTDNTAKNAKGADNVYGYTVPADINKVIVTIYSANGTQLIIRKQAETAILPTNVISSGMGHMKVRGDLSDGQSLLLPYENVKNNVVVSFSARITSFNSIDIGKRTDHRYVTINAINLIVNDGSQEYTVAHGLTIAQNISVTITSKVKTMHLDKIVIESQGEVFEYTNGSIFWENDNGSFSVASDNSMLTDCVLSWTSRTINNKLWMFGDSYFSLEPSRWTYYLLQDDYDAPLINAFSGETSAYAISALKNLIQTAVPNTVLWCLGMNDGNDSASAPSNAWKTGIDELVNLSKQYGFKIVLATIPLVASVANAKKNEAVRASDYDYIDFAKAVNVGTDGTWITGALSNDGVHPTKIGAKILYRRALADCPQLTSKA